MAFSVISARVRECLVVSISGDLDRSTAPALEKELRAEWQRGTSLILDLAEVPFCDSSGIRVLTLARRWATHTEDFLGLVAPAPRVTRVLQITSLDSAFMVYDSLAEALDDAHQVRADTRAAAERASGTSAADHPAAEAHPGAAPDEGLTSPAAD